MEVKQIFVPGRLCLFGEHSDTLAATMFNHDKLTIGHTIAMPLRSVGITANVKDNNEGKLIITNNKLGDFSCELNIPQLDNYIKYSDTFSYIAGTSKHMMSVINDAKGISSFINGAKGVSINIESNTLPIGVGLSSSAAICTLIVKAFDYVYNLNLSTDQIMYHAWYGEHTYTSSKCGRLDQICGYDGGMVHMVHQSDSLQIDDISIKKSLYFIIIIDSAIYKDTSKILQDLQAVFLPHSNHRTKKYTKMFFFDYNEMVIDKAIKYMYDGNVSGLGELMTMTQLGYNAIASDYIHSLNDSHLEGIFKYISNKVYGYKGLGSHGGTSAIALCYDELNRDFLLRSLRDKYPDKLFIPVDVPEQL